MKEDWVECRLGDVGDIISGGTPKTDVKEYWNGKIPWITPADLSNYNNKYISIGKKSITDIGLSKSSAKLMPKNSILFSSRAPIGYTVIAQNILCTNQGFKSLIPHNNIFSEYIYYYLKSAKQMAEKNASGTTFKEISAQSFSNLPIPLPPLPIQRAIVSKIETLFTSLDKGIADLKTAQEQLKIYRQAVLKKAFEGELTRKWREDIALSGNKLPTADELLEEIKLERKTYYENQLKEWEADVKKWEKNDKKGSKPGKPRELKDFNKPEKELELEIPHKSWIIICLGNISSGVEYGSSDKSLDKGKVPVVRMGNIQNSKLDWSDLKYSNNEDEIHQYSLNKGDILFNRTNSPELVGKTAEYKGEHKAIFAGYLIRVNHIKSIINSSYLNYFLNSHPAKTYGNYVKTDGVNQSNINGEKLSNYPIPIPSLPEQNQIVLEIEKRLSVCDKLEESISESLERAKALRQSILKKAFDGKLLTPNEIEACKREKDYEPASELLKKIKLEKENIV
jgi:type I restriction enzyme, S subunit